MKLKTRVDKQKFLAQATNVRRVMIARDVISAIRAQDLLARTGTYANIADRVEITESHWAYKSLDKIEYATNTPTEVDICHAVQDTDKVCVCCARGALLMARIGFQHPADEDCTTDLLSGIWPGQEADLNDEYNNRRLLESDFTSSEVKLIEAAFECDSDFARDNAEAEDAAEFGKLYANPDKRLVAIMKNIIANRGEFIPPRRDVG